MSGGSRPNWVALLVAAALGCATGFILNTSHQSTIEGWVRFTQQPRTEQTAGYTHSQAPLRGSETWPVSRLLHCDANGWQQQYLQLHRDILTDVAPPRFMLAYGLNGLADSLIGAVTLFWIAVLQRRAFAMQFGPHGFYEWAFDQPYFNWTWSPDYIYANQTLRFRLDYASIHSAEAEVINHGDVRTLGENYTALLVPAYVGYVRALLSNPHHKAELSNMGLHPHNMFACGVDFLLRLNKAAMEPYAEQYATLTEPTALKIGIHIRVGDNQLVGHAAAANISDFEAWFDCADQLENLQRWSPDRVVRWFLVTDSLALRQQAKEMYGDKLVTELHPHLGHTRAEYTRAAAEQKIAGRDTHEKMRVFQAAAAEMWLLSLTDYQVITTHSGYGRIAAFMSGKFSQVYGIEHDKDSRTPAPRRTCSSGNYMPIWRI